MDGAAPGIEPDMRTRGSSGHRAGIGPWGGGVGVKSYGKPGRDVRWDQLRVSVPITFPRA